MQAYSSEMSINTYIFEVTDLKFLYVVLMVKIDMSVCISITLKIAAYGSSFPFSGRLVYTREMWKQGEIDFVLTSISLESVQNMQVHLTLSVALLIGLVLSTPNVSILPFVYPPVSLSMDAAVHHSIIFLL
jgi:hypothetical protein